MPDPVWARLTGSASDFAAFIEVWADCVDYGYGIMEVLHPFAETSDSRKFLASADKELRFVRVITGRDSRKSIQIPRAGPH